MSGTMGDSSAVESQPDTNAAFSARRSDDDENSDSENISQFRYANGDIALPKNSSLIVEVSNWSEDLVSINAIAITKNSLGKLIEQKIPPKTLLMKDENNEPMEFEEKSNDDSSFLNDVVEEGAGALPVPNEVGSVINGTISGSSGSGDTIYHVEADKDVSVYVNKSIAIKK